MNRQFEEFEFDNMRKNPENYKWGIFYFNPKDRRIFLPKRNQWMGWTLNFANPYSYLIIIILLSMIFIVSLFPL